MRMRNALLAAAVISGAAALLGPKTSLGGTVIYQTGFEAPDYVLGDLISQNNWFRFDGDTPFPNVTVQNGVVRPVTGGSQAVHFQATGPSVDPYADFTDVWSTDTYVSQAQITSEPLVHIQWDMMRGEVGFGQTPTSAWGIDIYDTFDNVIASTVVVYDDLIGPGISATDADGASVFLGDGPTRGSWNTYAIDINYTNRTYTVSLDGNVLGGAVSINASADNGIGDVDFLSWLRGTDSAYFDNLSISTSAVPEPASLGLVGIAGLLLGRRRRA